MVVDVLILDVDVLATFKKSETTALFIYVAMPRMTITRLPVQRRLAHLP